MRHEYLSINHLENNTINSNTINVDTVNVGGGGYVSKEINYAVSKTSGSYNVFTISGAVRVKLVGECTMLITPAGAGGLLSLGVNGALTGLITATTASGIDADEWWVSSTAHSKRLNVSSMIDKLINGATAIKTNVSGTSMTTGKIKFHVWWEPLETGATVVAA